MVDIEKAQFKSMMRALTTLYGKQELDQELLRIWWHKLNRFEFSIVSKSFDTWVDTNKKMPTPADIIEMCKAREMKNIPVMIGRKITDEQKAENHQKLMQVKKQLGMIH